jgi:3-oxoacyl-[acyl-carrier-protein] synthase II
MDIAAFWSALSSGRTGIRTFTQLDTTGLRTSVGGEIPSDEIVSALKSIDARPDERCVNLAQIASAQALLEAGIITQGSPAIPSQAGVIFGTGVGAAHSLYSAYSAYNEKGFKGVRPTTVPRCMANSITAQLSMMFGLTGPNYVTICACASATTAIGAAFRMVRDGYTSQILSGGADAFFEPVTFAAWNNLGVMSRDPNPATACKPFDAERDGCVLGEGAAALVLEDLDHALSRGATIHAEILGYGESSDARHITSPSAEGQALAIRAALECAGVSPEDTALINAHGTATKANDETEAASIRDVFGSAAERIPVVSNKSYFGHMLGASGAAETIASILMLENGKITPNLNLQNPDPACPLNLPNGSAIDLEGDIIVKNSFGFGGNNAVLVIKRAES